MTSLCRHLSAQEIVIRVTTADGCVHTDDTTKLSPKLRIRVHIADADATKQFRRVGVGGVYWALDNFCILGDLSCGVLSIVDHNVRTHVF